MSIMTCRDVTITSQTRHFEFEAAILNPKPAVTQLTMTSPKIYAFVLRNILSQNKDTKVKLSYHMTRTAPLAFSLQNH